MPSSICVCRLAGRERHTEIFRDAEREREREIKTETRVGIDGETQ